MDGYLGNDKQVSKIHQYDSTSLDFKLAFSCCNQAMKLYDDSIRCDISRVWGSDIDILKNNIALANQEMYCHLVFNAKIEYV